MVAVSDFSGLVSSPWALARAAAIAPIVHWSGASAASASRRSKLIGPGFRAFGPQAVPDGFLGILRNQLLKVGLGALMLLMGRRVRR